MPTEWRSSHRRKNRPRESDVQAVRATSSTHTEPRFATQAQRTEQGTKLTVVSKPAAVYANTSAATRHGGGRLW